MNETTDCATFLVEASEVSALIRDYDWSSTTLGPMQQWPAAMRTTIAMILRSPLPMATLWGEDGILIYNDAYSLFAGARHPKVLGVNVRQGWPEVAAFNDHVVGAVYGRGETLSFKDQELTLLRGDVPAPVWMNLDYSPVLDDDGARLGVIAIVIETTERVLADRQLRDERVRLQQMHDQSPTLMALLEGPDHRFTLINPAFHKVIGQRDILGRTVAETLKEAVEQGYLDLLNEVYTSGTPHHMDAAPYDVPLTPGGPVRRRYLDFVYQPLTNARHEVTGIFVNGVDVTERVLAQETIREREARFRIFAETMPHHVWTASSDGVPDWVNERMLQYCGLGMEALQDKRSFDLIHPEDRDEALDRWSDACASGQRYESELRILRYDGQYRWHLVRALPLRNDEGSITLWIGTNTDIHDQKQAEAESTQDRDRLWNLSQDLMLVCDFGGIITAINPSAQHLLGWSESEMLGQPLSRFLHPDDEGITQAKLGNLSLGASTLAFENRYRCKDGTYRLLDWTAVLDGGRIHAVGPDITQERRLASERERIWSLSPVVQLTASRNGTIVSVNPAWSALLGWTKDQTLGRKVLDFVLPKDRLAVEAQLRRLLDQLADETSAPPLEAVVMTSRDEQRHIEWTTVADSEAIYAFGRDITAEMQAAAALASSEAALRQAHKMEAIGQLTGGIAHDFNNLLQVIGGSLQLLATNPSNDDKARRRLQNAMEGVARGSRLASQLLAFGRRQPLAPRVVNLGRLIQGMDEMLRHALGEAVAIEMRVDDDLWNTLIDRGNLENALLNLAIKARGAMEGHGRLLIRVANEQLVSGDPDLMPGQYVVLSVTDNGVGIPPDVLEKVFDPFFSTKPEGKGSGLGLSMVYGFVKQSGGHVRIDSQLGQGTTIRLYLPRSLLPEGEVQDQRFGPVAGGTETILVAEDDPGVRETLVDTLKDLGYHVLQAVDAQSALAVIDSGAQIDLLFTDVVMPGPMKSADLARLAVERLPGLKILFTSGYAENAIVHAGRLDEGVELLSKPYGREDLARRLRHQLANGAQQAVKPSGSDGAAVQGNRLILVCEDDALIRMSVGDMLEDLGHSVLLARDATTALSLLAQNRVDLLLTDVGLPDMPGNRLAQEARERDPELPVIFATGHNEVEGASLDNRTALLMKPFDDRRLAAAIAAIDF